MARVLAVVADEQIVSRVCVGAHGGQILAFCWLDANAEAVYADAVEVLDGRAGLVLRLELHETYGWLVRQDFDSDNVTVDRE